MPRADDPAPTDDPSDPAEADGPPAEDPSAALARLYDLDLSEDPGDGELYQALAARTGGPILELAAGSGRLGVPLALAGYEVVAVDNDPAMLARAAAAWGRRRGRRPADRFRPVEADLTAVRLEERFGLAFIALNSLLLVGDQDAQLAALRTLAAHLRHDGLAVVDIYLPDADDLAMYDGRVQLEWVRDDPSTGERVLKLSSARHDPAVGTVDLTQVFEAAPRSGGAVHRVVRSDRLHLLSPGELRLLAGAAGLVIETMAGDYQVTPLGPGAERAVLVARTV